MRLQVGFNLEDYEPVQSRFARFIDWSLTQDNFYSVVSEMLSVPGADICVFKTSIICDGVVVATGHAEEVRGAGNVNRTSHAENCETSSLGRCLSNFPRHNFAGTDVNKRPSREEMMKVQNNAPKMRITQAPSAKGDGVSIKGNQWGPIPDWLVLEAAQAGVTQVWDNRDQLAANPKRPWFKDANGDKAFWAPKGTPLPVMATHEDDLDESPEEPF
jgi:hypothetical protein